MMLCACLAEESIEKCRKKAKEIGTELVEHRIDYMKKVQSLDILYQEIKQPVIATIRPSWEGGRYQHSDSARLKVLRKAIEAECAAVDIEIGASACYKEHAIKMARKYCTMIIMSKHYFGGTPPLSQLISLMDQMKAEGAQVGKIVTTAHDIHDCEVIFDLLKHAKTMDFPLVSFAMGREGIISRIGALKHGAPFMYVSAGRPTAPGQLDASLMRRLMREWSIENFRGSG